MLEFSLNHINTVTWFMQYYVMHMTLSIIMSLCQTSFETRRSLFLKKALFSASDLF